MLSEVSPLSPMKSGTWSGRIAVAQLDPLGRVDVDVGDAARRHHQARCSPSRAGRRRGRSRRRVVFTPGLVGAGRERRDHVVRLPALELEVAVAERLDDRPEVRELLAQEVGHRPPALLVDDVRGLGDRGAVRRARVPGDRDALRPVVGEQLEEHVREAEQRVRREAVARRELLREREEGPVGEVVAVDEEELGVPRGAVVELQLLSGERLRHTSKLSSRGDGTPRDSSIFRRVRPAAGELLADPPPRAPRAEPLLPARYEDPAAAQAEVEALRDARGRLGRGRAARRPRRRLPARRAARATRSGARTSGSSSPGTPSRSRRTCATSTPRRPHAGSTRAASRHYALVPATDPALSDAWSRVGFGQQHAHGIREVPETGWPEGVRSRRGARRRRARRAGAAPVRPSSRVAGLRAAGCRAEDPDELRDRDPRRPRQARDRRPRRRAGRPDRRRLPARPRRALERARRPRAARRRRAARLGGDASGGARLRRRASR